MTVQIFANALKDVARFFEDLPDIAEQAAVIAINDVAERQGLTAIRREMRKQIDFPSGYLESGGRLRVSKRANRGSIEAMITGRDRATSLARFAAGQNPQNTRGRKIVVKVKGNQSRTLDKAFMVPLKSGNKGIAVRLKPGAQLRNSQKAVRLSNNVYLLYGPSVDQVFRGVANQESAQILQMVTNRFLQQFARLTRG